MAAGTGSLGVAHMQLIRAFGPALAVTVLTAMVVSMTLAPALIGIFGNALFWPGPRWLRKSRHEARQAAAANAAGERLGRIPRSPWRVREQIAKVATFWPVALVIVAGCVLVLLGAAVNARSLRLGAPLVTAMPGSTQPARAQAAAAQGFAAGIVSPTEVLVLRPGVASDTTGLDRLQAALAKQPGVAGVVGPATIRQAAAKAALPAVAALVPNPMVAKSGCCRAVWHHRADRPARPDGGRQHHGPRSPAT